ncbi:hypothetical protein CBR_g36996 [Chara braunii]|uniref:Myb-like domain-containing protein n=1 Tax=Chara braunii TaxID=69332 RepID=A0A388JZM5_CHABU|nr:hypothetical protein CBR_g36996 [Chara braunii]|eukprot:GBG63227.1 hypothetical protein CBR_g36996 [Chara braunii]
MADVFRRLPLLLLVVLLLLLVVLFRLCILGNMPPRRRKIRSSMKDARMEARQEIPRSDGEQVGGRRCGGSLSTVGRASQRVGCDALPPHLQPLPGSSDEEEEVERRPQTVSLGSGSMQPRSCAGRAAACTSSRSLNSFDMVLAKTKEMATLTFVDRSARTRALASETAGANRNSSTAQPGAASLSKSAQGRPEWMQLPSPLSAASEVARGRGVGVDGGTDFLDVGDGRDGREVWRDLRRDHRLRREEYITQGVECLHVGDRENKNETDDPPADAEDDDDDDEDNNTDMAGKGGKSKPSGRNARSRAKKRQGKGSGGEGDRDAKEKRNFWSVEHIIALIRAKRDQDAHMQGMEHAYARMKPREWKWQDVAQRLKNVGVYRNAEKCGKKWDNLMQQFMKVHHFQSPSGGVGFFMLTSKERASRSFNFTMDRAVYDEIEGSTGMNHTIHPRNVADTGASGGVHPPSTSYVDPDSVVDEEGGAGREDDKEGSTRGSSQTTGTPGVSGKRKNTRQQTFEALTECMEKQWELMASTMESASKRQCSIQVRQCEALEAEVEVQRKHYAASDERKGVKVVAAGSARDVVEEVVVEEEMTNDDDGFEDDDDEPQPRKARVGSAVGIRINEGGEGTPAARRGGGVAAANQPVFVDVARDVARRDVAGRAKEGAASHETAQRVLVPVNRPRTPAADVAGGSQAAVEGGTSRSPAVAARGGAVAVPGEAVDVPKGGDGVAGGEDDEALVHRLRGQRAATHAMDAAAKLWEDDNRVWNDTQGSAVVRIIQEAPRISLVSPMLFYTTLNADMKLPFWFMGVNIVDRHEDDECTAYQEACIQRLVRDFTSVVGTAEAMDGGRVSYERLKGMAKAMRYLLAATMWIMRMAGEDPRSHYDAWVFVQLMAKTMLLASVNCQFVARRHITQSAQVMTDKLGRPPPTFAPPPVYIPDWASKCGVTFWHDATLASPTEAKRLDWLGTGPPEDDDDDAEGDDKGEGG